jgi:5-methylcytosine-specific restriction endonuclease McrA
VDIYQSAAWRAVRKRVLARDGYQCRIGHGCCRGRANSVDHIVRPEDGGALFDEENLQAACVPCNTAKRNREVARRARRAQVRPW